MDICSYTSYIQNVILLLCSYQLGSFHKVAAIFGIKFSNTSQISKFIMPMWDPHGVTRCKWTLLWPTWISRSHASVFQALNNLPFAPRYSHVIMNEMASHIHGVSIVYSTLCSGADQRKHQSCASLASVRGIHMWLLNGQRASNADNVFIWWRHHVNAWFQTPIVVTLILAWTERPVWTCPTILLVVSVPLAGRAKIVDPVSLPTYSPFHEISASWRCLEFQPITGALAMRRGTVCCYPYPDGVAIECLWSVDGVHYFHRPECTLRCHSNLMECYWSGIGEV